MEDPATPFPGVTNTYPLPEATHEAVSSNPDLFKTTLTTVLQTISVQEKIPRVGGRELDLHMLYRNVCGLGGCQRVISRKLWREAAEPFNFPDTITSVSYSLRKAYINFLWDYEQVYFHRVTGPRVQPPQQISKADASGIRSGDPKPSKKRKSDVVKTQFPPLSPAAPTALVAVATSMSVHLAPGQPEATIVGSRGTIHIDARTDCGYFVTARVGQHAFQGLLYFPPPEHTLQEPAFEELLQPRRPGRPRKDQGGEGERRGDPHAPKPNKTPFNFFSIDARIKAKEAFPNLSQADITKKVGEMWARAAEDEKAPYIAMSNQDKLRYQADLEAYNYRLAAQAAASHAQAAAQQVVMAQRAMAQQPLQVAGELYGAYPTVAEQVAVDHRQ